MPGGENYYKILGVDSNSSESEIKKAYRALSMKYHPDRNPGDRKAEEKFKEINQAYEILGDQESKKRYDLTSEEMKVFDEHSLCAGKIRELLDEINDPVMALKICGKYLNCG